MEGSTENTLSEPKQMLIHEPKKSKFPNSCIYFNFATTFGVNFSVTATFPNQLAYEAKMK